MLAKKTIRKKRFFKVKRFSNSGFLDFFQKTALNQGFILKYILGVKQHRFPATKAFSLSWRFVAVFLFVFYLITGIGPLDFCFKSIDALGSIGNKEKQTVAFYSGNSFPDSVSDDYELGWWGNEKSVGAPSVNSSGGLFLFSSDNSSFYSGGHYSMVLGNFNPGEKIIKQEETSVDGYVEDIEQAAEAEIINEDNEAEGAVFDNADLEGVEEDLILTDDKENSDDVQVEILTPESKSVETINNDTSEDEKGDDLVVSVVEDDFGSEDEIEVDIEDEEYFVEPVIMEEDAATDTEGAPEEGVDLSFVDKIRKYFSRKEALAIDGGITSSMDSIFGKFVSAKIKISLAFGSNMKNESLLYNEGIFEDESVIDFVSDSSEKDDLILGDAVIDEEIEGVGNDEEAEEFIFEEEDSYDEEVSIGDYDSESEEDVLESEESADQMGDGEDEIISENNTDLLSVIRNFLDVKKATAEGVNARLVIWYTFDDLKSASGDVLWQELDTIYGDNFSNAINKGYLNYEAPFIGSWQDLSNLNIKVEGLSEGKSDFVVYLDSIWVEADYESGRSNVESEASNIMEMLSYQLDFKINEEAEFRFKYNKEKTVMNSISESFGFSSYWSDVDLRTEVVDNDGNIVDLPLTILFEENGEFFVKMPELPRRFKPGKYTIKFYIEDKSSGKSEFINFEQDFSWGVLALNIDKSVYSASDDSAFLQIGVLDNEGHTVCDADLFLEIYSPENGATYLSTNDGSIVKNSECGFDNVIDTPDYFTHYMLYGEGQYEVRLFASTTNGLHETTEFFEVKDSVLFDVERVGPSRINPVANYQMVLNVKANADFNGSIMEYLPEDFFLVDQSVEVKNASSGEYILYDKISVGTSSGISFSGNKTEDAQAIIWGNLNIKNQDELRFTYEFDAPNVSPEFYLLGPLKFVDTSFPDVVFEEERQWQIASDAVVNIKATNGINVSWTNASSAFDSTNNNTYASRVILRKTGTTHESGLYLEMTTNSASNLGGIINSVEIGVEGHVQNTAVTAYVSPYFNGSTLGSEYTVPALGTTADVDTPKYVDITNDVNRPNYPSPWTWQEIIDLNARVYGGNVSNSADYNMYVDMIHVRVDYTPNNAPTSTIESALQRIDDSGVVDMEISVGDIDGDNMVRAKLEYEAGTSCIFSPGSKATLDETDETATSTYADVKIDNNSVYQIGSSTGWIETATGSNHVYFDWLSASDLNNQEGEYCLQLTAFDGDDAQVVPATTTVLIDNKAPSAPGELVATSTTKNSVQFEFGDVSTDINFNEYIIYWKVYDGFEVTETDNPFSSTTDINLSDRLFNGFATTSIEGLEEDTDYSFAVYAYDAYGHVSSSSRVDLTTNKTPLAVFNSALEKSNGSGIIDISTEVYDGNHDESRMKIEYESGTDCLFLSSDKPTLDETQSNIYSSFGVPRIDNNNDYQVGTASGYIVTTASNTVEFDWFSAADLNDVEGEYCLKLTANDQIDDQNIGATTTVMVDNKDPGTPGDLVNNGVSTSTVELLFGAVSTDLNFKEYRIYYKEGTSGVSESDILYSSSDDANLGDRLFNGFSTTTISGLDANMDYVFNIWAYDYYGHKVSATEVAVRTNAYIKNESLVFVNPSVSNIAVVDDATEWIFRAEVGDEEGWTSLSNVTLRLQNRQDTISPYDDLKFNWNQTTNSFSEIGTDNLGMVSLSGNSTSTCSLNTCVLDFNLVFNSNFATSSIDYDAELYSTNDSLASDNDVFANFYQIRLIRLEQIHYRWRNDDGGE